MPGCELLVATAGHVDHGKSTIVRHLTGVDPDRLAEERRRGLSIELGFAVAALPSGAAVSFVDVPGHAQFLSTMVAGVGSVSACLFVVSAVEGWRTQSEEHLRVLELLGIEDGIVVLSRAAGVDARRLVTVREGVAESVAGTFLAGRESVAVDLPAGLGAAPLLAALERLVARAAPPARTGRPRLWVDRAFTIAGAGTVVTGSLAGGDLAVGATVDVLGRADARRARVRGLQVHGLDVGRTGPGRRVAVNLAGLGVGDVGRGDAVIEPGRWHATRTIDGALTVLPGAAPVEDRRGAYLAHLGTDEQAVHLRVIGGARVDPGATGPVRLRLDRALPLRPGDRFVLRDSGRATTVGGGLVLDVDPVLPTSRAAPDLDPARVVAERGWVEAHVLDRLTGTRLPEVVPGWVGAPEVVRADRARLAEQVGAAGAAGLAVDALTPRDRLLVAGLDDVVVAAGRARHAAATLAESRFLEALRADPFRPPAPADLGCPPGELRALRAAGLAVHHDGTYFAADAVARAAREVAALLADCPEGITVAQVRDALGTTRRWALPLLALLDEAGVTRRRGDRRVRGPAPPEAAPTSGG